MDTDISPPTQEVLDAAMKLLPGIAKTWAAVPELSQLEEEGLGLLVAGGFVERRISLHLRAVGDDRVVAIRFRFSGQAGLPEALEPALAEAWDLWQATWREGKKVYVEPPQGEGEWRLTGNGEKAVQQIADCDTVYLRDFLRTPGVPGVTPLLPPLPPFLAGEARPVVEGEGHVERVEVINADSEPLSVHVENLGEVSGPLGDIARAVQEGLERLAEGKQKEPSEREETDNTLRRQGEFWTFCYEGQTIYVADLQGMNYLSHLLERPRHEFGALELSQLVNPPEADNPSRAQPHQGPDSVGPPDADEAGGAGGGRGLAPDDVLDAEAMRSIRKERDELLRELEDAKRNCDEAEQYRISREIGQIDDYLSDATLSGRTKQFQNEADKARQRIRKALDVVLDKIGGDHERLATHLRNSIHTGFQVVYLPEPPIQWRVKRM